MQIYETSQHKYDVLELCVKSKGRIVERYGWLRRQYWGLHMQKTYLQMRIANYELFAAHGGGEGGGGEI
jgi:hypothetical protein